MSLINIRGARARAPKEHVFNWKSVPIVVSIYMESVLSVATYFSVPKPNRQLCLSHRHQQRIANELEKYENQN